MDSEKLIVVLLIITVLLSVVTMGITISLNVDKFPKPINPENLVNVNHANVGFTVNPTSENGGTI